MKKWLKRIGIFLLSLIVLAALAIGGFIWYQNAQKFISVLVFSKTESFRHESIAAGKTALLKMGKEHGFTVDTTEDASVFNEQQLQKYNVVVFLNTTGDILNDAQQLEFNRFIQAGGGFVGIHAAADTEYDWPWYGELMGAYFNGHPNDPNVRDAEIERIDVNHISTSMLPDVWPRSDEWYNYRDIQPTINVLLNLDEDSYEGGTNGEKHPIAWYHDFDGGRSWYTGLGHTDETFSEELFLEHLLGGITYAAGPQTAVNFNNANVAPEENRFTKVVLEDNLHEPMELEILPNGHPIFIERIGNVKTYDPEAGETRVMQEFNVFSGLEDGLLGMAADPDMADNHWIYFYYSDPERSVQKLSRFTMAEDFSAIDMSSEKLLLEVATQREECCHSGGSIEFGPGGLLYLSTGDNTNPHQSEGYAPADEREGRSPWDAQKSAANSKDLRGKILRIKPEADGTYSIPDGNLFTDAAEGRPEIYVMGCRNPFRISVDQHTGYLYWGEVGPDARSDSSARGPRGYDEVNQAKAAGFFGWPYFVGNNYPYHKVDFATGASQGPHDPKKPMNTSPHNTGTQQLPPANPAFIWYPYADSEEFPLVGNGGRNAMAGPVFYLDDYPDNEWRYPAYYNEKLFIYDWIRGWIMAVTLDEEGNYKRMEPFLPNIKWNNPIDIVFSGKGDMYLLEYGSVWFAQNPDARLVHLAYASGNRKPVARIELDKSVGSAPLSVQFDATKSKDFDGDDLTYEWYFENNETLSSTDGTTAFTFDEPGEYQVKLIARDPGGEVSEATQKILVGNELPQISWKIQGNQTFFWEGSPFAYEVEVSDPEDGTLGNGIDPSRVVVTIDYLERGYDANEIAMGHQALMEASQFVLGKSLIAGSDCAACHQPDVKSIGPSYLQIAEKYKGQDDATPYLANKIISGGGGVWGETVMAAHPQLSNSEAQQMARYILSLSGEDLQVGGLSTKGSYAFDRHKAGQTEGRYIFTASYTDKGGKKIGPLTARDVFALRAPVVGAAEADQFNTMKFVVDPDQAQGMVDEPMTIMLGSDGNFLLFKDIDLTGITAIKTRFVRAGAYFKGGRIDFHLDSMDGPILSGFDIKTSITDMGMDEISIPIPATPGMHDLYITFSNGSGEAVTALIELQFESQLQ
ncbi:ThuA domain-containing protein [Flavilitoribacter nigricans]|uniref:Carbohydrate-binding protein n=1 Tax=Flavilitoribacter nigricans (strain ATCC 23147 / DSM 23189 / NBRC 102662 / NCIMB 1420 / SS-2) TaxID=1122177 RepID=A0A2D0NC56_FLAN2|nr:ThuA domain-containing protein [Flavilitoribacter nigricans]PHN05950.1 hypothetical protein CRP01_13300 [Flavilitoribacter nigricans DSM 23189 = NBRC 102662]